MTRCQLLGWTLVSLAFLSPMQSADAHPYVGWSIGFRVGPPVYGYGRPYYYGYYGAPYYYAPPPVVVYEPGPIVVRQPPYVNEYAPPPTVVTVRDLPSAETTILPVAMTLPAFLMVMSRVWSLTTV